MCARIFWPLDPVKGEFEPLYFSTLNPDSFSFCQINLSNNNSFRCTTFWVCGGANTYHFLHHKVGDRRSLPCMNLTRNLRRRTFVWDWFGNSWSLLRLVNKPTDTHFCPLVSVQALEVCPDGLRFPSGPNQSLSGICSTFRYRRFLLRISIV